MAKVGVKNSWEDDETEQAHHVNYLLRDYKGGKVFRSIGLGNSTRALETLRTAGTGPPTLRPSIAVITAHEKVLQQQTEAAHMEPLEDLIDVVAESLEEEHKAACVANDGGTLVSFGSNDLQLGYIASDKMSTHTEPRRVDIPFLQSANRIVALAAGPYHSIAIDAMGKVWSWGHGRYGRLGNGDEKARVIPCQVQNLEACDIRTVAAGRDHSIALDRDGSLYCWGSSERGQLGVGSSLTKSLCPTRLIVPSPHTNPGKPRSTRNAETTQLFSRKSASFEEGTRNKHSGAIIRALACGAAHSVAIDLEGNVFTWGSNEKGQLGMREYGQCRKEPKHLVAVSKRDKDPIRSACASDGATYLLSEKGAMFQLGLGSYHPLRINFNTDTKSSDGSSSTKEEWFTRSAPVKVATMACGPQHAAAVSTSGKLYTWGTYADLLGHVEKGCDRTQQSHTIRPIEVVSLRGRNICSVSCARNHTCAIDSIGNLYTWGNGVQSEDTSATLPTYQPVPRRIAKLRRVSTIASGGLHTFAIVAQVRPHFIDIKGTKGRPSSVSVKPKKEENEDDGATEQSGTADQTTTTLPGPPADTESERAENIDSDLDSDSDSDSDSDLDLDSEKEVREIEGKGRGDSFSKETPSDLFQPLSLQVLCERELVRGVNPWNCLQLWEFADMYYSKPLLEFCQDFVSSNLDAVLVAHKHNASVISVLMGCSEEEILELYERYGHATPDDRATSLTKTSKHLVPEFKPAGVSPKPTEERQLETLRNNLKVMSLPRLKSSLETSTRQLEGLQDRQLSQSFHGTPNRQKRKELAKQVEAVQETIRLLECELESRNEETQAAATGQTVATDPLRCELCQVRVQQAEGMAFHMAGKRHRKNLERRNTPKKIEPPTTRSRPWSTPGHQSLTPRIEMASSGSFRQNRARANSTTPFALSAVSPVQATWNSPSRTQPQLEAPAIRGSSRKSSTAGTSPHPNYQGNGEVLQRHASPMQLPQNAGSSGITPMRKMSLESLSNNQGQSNLPSFESQKSLNGVSLSDFITRAKHNKTKNVPAPWFSGAKPPRKDSVETGQLMETMAKMDLSTIQQEQLVEKDQPGVNRAPLAESSWGMCQGNVEKTFADIQAEEALDLESERLARMLALEEGQDQERLLAQLTAPEKPRPAQRSKRSVKRTAKRSGKPKSSKLSAEAGTTSKPPSTRKPRKKRAPSNAEQPHRRKPSGEQPRNPVPAR